MHPASHGGEKRIPAEVPVLVVHRLEVVKIQHDQSEIRACSFRTLQLGVQHSHPVGPVQTLGQTVHDSMGLNLCDQRHIARTDTEHG